MQKGCACKFLYGEETEDDKKAQIDKALQGKMELKMEVKFYKKQGKKERESPGSCVMYLTLFHIARPVAACQQGCEKAFGQELIGMLVCL